MRSEILIPGLMSMLLLISCNSNVVFEDFESDSLAKWKVEGDAMWQRFHQKDAKQQAWYYRSIVKLTERLSNTSAWLEYKTLTELVFGKGE